MMTDAETIPQSLGVLAAWVELGLLRPLDRALTRFLAERGPESDTAVLLAAALTSARNGHGHVCLDLKAVLDDPDAILAGEPPVSDATLGLRAQLAASGVATPEDFAARLAASACVCDARGSAADLGELADADQERLTGDSLADPRPLVLAGSTERPLLYLRRYWLCEQRIRAALAARLGQPPPQADAERLRAALNQVFGPTEIRSAGAADWPRIACALASRSGFFIVTGGPGTGKTTTVLALLAVLRALVPAGQPGLRIALAAPTGKAAARLNESIAEQLARKDALIPSTAPPGEVKTLHRLLGTIPGSRHFRHHAARPLAADLVVVDEASMVDVEMMASLLDAMHPSARLILLGDKDQLSSVEAGAVLGDLCARAANAHYSRETAAWIAQATGLRVPEVYVDDAGKALDQAIVMLRQSYRFSAAGGIGALAALVNRPRADGTAAMQQRLHEVTALFAHAQGQPTSAQTQKLGSIDAVGLDTPSDAELAALVGSGYGGNAGYLKPMREQLPPSGASPAVIDDWARKVLEAQKAFQVLAAVRRGAWGVEGLNQFILATLRAAGLLTMPEGVRGLSTGQWFPGRPVLVTRNDYGLHLMNGDIGVALPVPRPHGRPMLRVAFPAAHGGVRWILPSRLQAIETVFAMTVHKSQGSEFNHTALVLPDRSNPVLTQELLYTAITRARQRFTLLYGSEAVLAETLARRVKRASGLGPGLV